MSEEKVLTKEIAAQFLADEDSVDLSEFTTIEDGAAESLSKHEGGNLSLEGLTELSDAAAQSLSKHEGELNLSGLSSLSDEVADNLSWAAGNLQLPSALSLLFSKKGNNISEKAIIQAGKQDAIDELISYVETVGDILCSTHNDESGCMLYDTISRFRFRMKLARNRGHLNAAVAEELLELEEEYQERDADIEIPPRPLNDNLSVLQTCTSIDDAAAEVLIKHTGDLYLNGLTDLSDAAAESLANKEPKFDCWQINLDNLPASAAQILRDAGHGE